MANEWGLSPDEFWAKDPEIQAIMMVHTRSKKKLEAIIADEHAQEMERKHNKIVSTKRGR